MEPVETHTTKVSRTLPKSEDAKKQRLQKATKEFESLFMAYMLKTMRTSIPESDLFGNNFGGDMFESMFDMQLANYSSKNGSLGVAKMLYRKLTGEDLIQNPAAVPIQKVTGQKDGNQTNRPQNDSTIKSTADIQNKLRPNVQSKLSSNNSVIQSSHQNVTIKPEPVSSAVRGKTGESKSVQSNKKADFKPSASLQERLNQLQSIIDTAAKQHGVDSTLVKAMIASESGGKVSAQSSAKAKGLMQLIDTTAAAMGVKNIWNPEENINGGVKYLRQMLDKFDGDIKLALASYNAGPGAIEKHSGVPPYKETRAYINRVMNYMKYFQQQETGDNEE